MPLSPAQKKYLRGLTHALHPIVMIGDKGLTENVTAEIEGALNHHELVKIKLRCDRESRAILVDEIARRCAAEKVHVIGQVASFFRRNPEKPVIELP